VLPAVWQRLQLLPKLSVVQLHEHNLTAPDVLPVSNLQHLQSLTVGVQSHNDASSIAAVVSTGLTALDLSAGWKSGVQSAMCLAKLPPSVTDFQEQAYLHRVQQLS
jgi:hypothetical protein